MKGSPKVYATRQDFMNAAKTYPEEAATALQSLMDGRFIWKETEVLPSREDGIESADAKIVETVREDANGEKQNVFVQMVRVEDENAAFFRMGWTVEAARAFILAQGV